ncbi:hypothetical protein Pla123a_35970 [Posidoniimonas polymericola]|uniref:FHA domain-containing protein n=1 Tax=Posidoniimonas polymericola TaxID=2528002 RepID=A0A5C5YF58_9BACT|nr:FHA domain-containing protein [Posidoniimonas polymericola]TWT73704.1 hypothetical protein Pla123a_35970 [Posidoniimonas polymericola]
MLQWRLKLVEARRALVAGRLEEALTALNDPQLQGFLPAKRLADGLAKKYAERAAQRIEWGQSCAGFADLAAIDQLGAHRAQADAIRLDYAQRVEQQATERLAAYAPDSALQLLRRGKRRGVDTPALRLLTEIARCWSEALEHADCGDSTRATDKLQRCVAVLCGDTTSLLPQQLRPVVEQAASAISERAARHRAAAQELSAAATQRDWSAVLRNADAVLAAAPRDGEAVRLRRRAWRELELDATRPYKPLRTAGESGRMNSHGESVPHEPGRHGRSEARRLARAIRETTHAPSPTKEDTSVGKPPADRRMLWVDAVGGFLVCLDDQIVIGQPAGGASPDLPILADISRRHAILRRESGSYVLEPIGSTKLDGELLSGPVVLDAEHLIQLGDGVRIRFTKPHALSATARLVIESGHKTTPSADAVLLMAESCVMGPARHSHVRCRPWADELIIYRQDGELCCRTRGPLTVDGRQIEGPVTLGETTRLEGQDFSVSVEQV